MSHEELWTTCQSLAIKTCQPYDRQFLWLDKEAFLLVSDYFSHSRNLLHPGRNYRSSHIWLHIHAIEQSTHVHLDCGNISRSWIFAFVHTYFDVIPYLWLAAKKRKKITHVIYHRSTS